MADALPSGAPTAAAADPAPRVPYYAQTLGFTCGPSSLLMAMNALDPAVGMSRAQELQLWREATSIFMGSGHGGCGALGLALAAHRRGFAAEVHLSHRGVLLADRARKAERREVMRILQESDLAAAAAAGIPVSYKPLGLAALEARLRRGWLPIVLVSTFYVHKDHTPHWVVVVGFDRDAVYINDPWVSRDKGRTDDEMTRLPVPRAAFEAMARYGKRKERAAVLIGRRAG